MRRPDMHQRDPRGSRRGSYRPRHYLPSAESLDRRLVPATAAWSQVGTIAGVSAIVAQVDGGSTLLAQKSDATISLYQNGQWTATNGALVPGTIVANGSTILGVAGGGTVFQYQVGGAWSQVGTLTGVAKVAIAVDLVPVVSPSSTQSFVSVTRYYAERTDGSVWVLNPSDAKPAWTSTGGTLEPGTMIADQTGVSGIAGGGTVFHYTVEAGWSQVGTLGGVGSLLSSGGTLLAERGDDAVWIEQAGTWTFTGGYIVPGTLIQGGVTVSGPTTFEGIGGGGTVWQYFPYGTWSQVGTLTGARSLAETSNSAGQQTLYAQLADGSVSAYTFGLGRWVATGGALLPGTMQATSPGILGVAGGGTVFKEDQANGQYDPFQGAVAVLGLDGFAPGGGTSTVPSIAYAQTADGMIWEQSGGVWARTGQPLVVGSAIAQNSSAPYLAAYNPGLAHPSIIGVAPDGRVWEEGFGPIGTLNQVARVVASSDTLFAQRTDGTVWQYNDLGSTGWTATGGTLVAGTLVAATFSPYAAGIGVAGVAGGGTVWGFANDGQGWHPLGTLDGVTQVVSSLGPSGHGELFAQKADGTVWSYDTTSNAWTSTGGSVVAGTLVADADGVAGVAGGGTVWSYADGKTWTRLGTLAGATSVLYSPNDSGTSPIFAQMADGSVSYYTTAAGVWTASGGAVAPGSLAALQGGVLGVGVYGTVYDYLPGLTWTPLARFT